MDYTTEHIVPTRQFTRIPDTPIIFPVTGMPVKRASDLILKQPRREQPLAPPPQTWDSTFSQQEIAVQTGGAAQQAQQSQA